MSESRWQDIVRHLKACNFDVYPPGARVEECESPYVVVKHNGGTKMPGISTMKETYSVMVYVPSYSILEMEVQRLKAAMKGLEPLIMPNGFQTGSFYDDGFKAHMVSVEYHNYKKIL
jgi:hypothetical protein